MVGKVGAYPSGDPCLA